MTCNCRNGQHVSRPAKKGASFDLLLLFLGALAFAAIIYCAVSLVFIDSAPRVEQIEVPSTDTNVPMPPSQTRPASLVHEI